MTITAKRLEELGACQSQIVAFRAIWGDDPAPMTVEAALEHAQVFNWDWAAQMLLDDAAWAECERARAAAWAEYRRACARAWAPAWDECQRTVAAAWAEYERAKARAFAEAYIKQEDAK
jgi:hypothetical protein